MIRAVEIKGLRGIRAGSLTDLTPLVVLVGPNGAGKSTILDALLIAANPRPPEGIAEAVERRVGLGARELSVGNGSATSQAERREGLSTGARWLLRKAGQTGAAEITVQTDSDVRCCMLSIAATSADYTSISGKVHDKEVNGQTSELEISTLFRTGERPRPSGFIKPLEDVPEVRFLDWRNGGLQTPLHQLYTRIVEQGRQQEAIATIQALIPGVENIQILAPEDVPIVYLSFGNSAAGGYAVPAALTGDGIRLLLHLTFELATRPGGLVLMEEPEAHLHPFACVPALSSPPSAARFKSS